ncbi:MAG: amidohydrolase family protein [Pseudomonadota bacterium]
MTRHVSYLGFPALPQRDEVIDALIHDPPDIRWRWIRALLRIEDSRELDVFRDGIQTRMNQLNASLDWRVVLRLRLALDAIQRPVRVKGYVLVHGKGAFKTAELEAGGYPPEKADAIPPAVDFFPVVDFHVHPKIPDLKFLSDMHKAGVGHAVLLATDTDPANLDRPEIIDRIRLQYSRFTHLRKMPLEEVLDVIRSGLYTQTHVTNRDVADWVSTYPEKLIGFGSVDPCKSKEYVQEKLSEIESFKFKGIKLLPYSQFFNPAENENLTLLFDYCRRTGSMVLSHTGCAAGAFELPELSEYSHPELWKPLATRYPDVPIVLAHFGSYSTLKPGIWFQEALTLMTACPNVYSDISAADYLLEDIGKVNQIRKADCFKQVLFATDYPGPLYHGISTQRIVEGINLNALLSESEKRMIFGGNARKLLGIDHPAE